jgi:glycosyltransferase involved in cell wall biosynthesis
MAQLKNILILNDFNFINGGTSLVAVNSANALADRGYRVLFFSAVEDAARSTLSSGVEQYSTNQCDILNNPSRIGAITEGLWNKKTARLLVSILKTLDPKETVVHLHGWIKALSPSVGRVLADSGFPLLLTLQDFFAACPNGGFYNYRKKEICYLKPMSLSCVCTNCDSRNYGNKAWRVIRQAIQSTRGSIPSGFKHFISVTRFSENILRPFLPADSSYYLIHNPVGAALPGHPRANVRTKRLLYVGRLSAEKGVDLACEAARTAGGQLTIIGDGPLRSALQEKYPEVLFRGWLTSAEILEEMLNAAALLFPSVWYETQGIVVLEALSVGLPVIVADKCAASEFIDSKNGFIFISGNVEDLTSKVGMILQDENRTEEMSKYAHERYWQNPLSLQNYVKEAEVVYNRVLDAHAQ